METQFKVFSSPSEIYDNMIKDIMSAKESVLLETYIFDNDEVGRRFRKALTDKVKEGVKVRLLLDAWGSQVKRSFFSEFINNGGELKKVREIKYVFHWFSANHERDHKKLLIIDGNITYVGSCNITNSCINWRELVLRIEGSFSFRFEMFFNYTWENKKIIDNIQNILDGNLEILYDFPSKPFSIVERRYLELINNAKTEIDIETPYFVPSFLIRKAIYQAIRRGVKVKILLPYLGDVKIMDIVRNRYIDNLYRKKAKIYFFKPKFSHAKLLIVDNQFFLLGSSNLDYRSFIHQYEINVFGENKEILSALKAFFDDGLKESSKFNYSSFKKRFSFIKRIEKFLKKFEKYF